MASATHSSDQPVASTEEMRILAIDIGGSGLKAAILNSEGELVTDRLRVKTPQPCAPEALVEEIVSLVGSLSDYDCVSVGFPGVVRKGKIITAPNLGTKELAGFDLAGALSERLAKPVRVVNDADMQGLGAIEGNGLEVVITLGTGFGFAVFVDGKLAPHLELSHHPFRNGDTYDEQIGNKALKKIGKKKWNRRVRRAIKAVRTLTNFDRLYIGGGNADKIKFKLDADTKIVSNEYGVRGGAWLWQQKKTDGN